MQNPLENLIAANPHFYEALASGDCGQMQRIWSDADTITCIHPGWGPVAGREARPTPDPGNAPEIAGRLTRAEAPRWDPGGMP
ncbi:MAG: nuclear transport factor 2 family protein [Arenicellales bacterium]|nr:nuclear transport factor 2 family protein [Arenicellales bacterium]MDP6550972.1 nuclear transport factor 2 family protein [Arenicellales bacterium]MDP6792073.1 nuclear transport factor 2 family protein [Arenicellales bacterium]MDP6919883.1 nuclear transport factor 2 family protein [Arenicellales bacterium]